MAIIDYNIKTMDSFKVGDKVIYPNRIPSRLEIKLFIPIRGWVL
jgi:hypothetical protein